MCVKNVIKAKLLNGKVRYETETLKSSIDANMESRCQVLLLLFLLFKSEKTLVSIKRIH